MANGIRTNDARYGGALQRLNNGHHQVNTYVNGGKTAGSPEGAQGAKELLSDIDNEIKKNNGWFDGGKRGQLQKLRGLVAKSISSAENLSKTISEAKKDGVLTSDELQKINQASVTFDKDRRAALDANGSQFGPEVYTQRSTQSVGLQGGYNTFQSSGSLFNVLNGGEYRGGKIPEKSQI